MSQIYYFYARVLCLDFRDFDELIAHLYNL